MPFKNGLLPAYARFVDSYDEIVRASAILESGMSYIDGSSPFMHSQPENLDRALYLIGLYQQELGVYLETFKDNLEGMRTHWDLDS